MDKIEILTNDLKSLLLLQNLKLGSYDAEIYALRKFNFDTSYSYKEQIFDCGYHAVEIKRSSEVWELLNNLPLEFREFKAHRRLYFNGQILNRNYSILDLHDPKIKSIYKEDLNHAYRYFIEHYVEGRFVPSFEQNKLWKNKFNLSMDTYLVNIQPWFYPSEFLHLINTNVEYHFENLKNNDREIAYPVSRGFGAIQECLRDVLSQYIREENILETPLKSFDAITDLDRRGGDTGKLYVVPVDFLCLLQNDKALEVAETEYAIVDVELQSEIDIDWSEILVAEPEIVIDRISSPQHLAEGGKSRFLQVEKEFSKGLCEKTVCSALVKDIEKVITSISQKPNQVKSYKMKRVPFRRFDNQVSAAAIAECISYIEDKFENIVVANRSILYRNFVDTYHDLKNAVHRKLKI